MKNIINYFYNLNVLELYDISNGVYFNINNNSYIFMKYDRSINEVKSIYSLYKELKGRNISINDIVLNRENQIISFVNNIPYILIKDNTKNGNIDINDLLYVQNNTLNIKNDKIICRNDWIKLWSLKLDYYDNNFSRLTNEYPLLRESIDFYIGLGENAVSYLVYNPINDNKMVLSHRRIDFSSFSFYNPINFILDNRVRDFSEYIKNMFFNGNISFDEFSRYIDYMNFNREEYILLISRLLFPTYYFDLFDSIINKEIDEDKIKNVLNKKNDYVLFLKNTFYYIIYTKKISLPYIEWIIRFQN